MPRANRYLLPGHIYHLTHRCHNRSFLFRFAKDRTEYCRRMRLAVREFGISLLTYAVTSNHTHLLVRAREPESVSRFMQKLEGEFAEFYNLRKRRSGAFWQGRYGCTMIEGGRHLWNCMKYIDLNMAEVLEATGSDSEEAIRTSYEDGTGSTWRYAAGCWTEMQKWTESIAVGSEAFIHQIEAQTRNRQILSAERTPSGSWTLREVGEPYGSFLGSKSAAKPGSAKRRMDYRIGTQ